MLLSKTKAKVDEYNQHYREHHHEHSRYISSRSSARTFFRKYAKPTDLPEFKGWIAKCEKRFAKEKTKKQ